MKNKVVYVISVIGILVFLLLISDSMAKANWWDKFGTPQYGGTITRHTASLAPDLDPYASVGGLYLTYAEALWHPCWTTDRNVWGFKTPFTPPEYISGLLAESWEQTDPTTLTVHLRHGVHWHNKPPTNGREFTSSDVVFHYNRILGIGDDRSRPSPVNAGRIAAIKNVIALDKYTVQFKYKYPSVIAFFQLLDNGGQNMIEAPEWVALGGPPSEAVPRPGGPPGRIAPSGPLADWKNAVGTGAWILSEYIPGISATYSRNPNYHGFDERHPDNRLPYADTLKDIVIADMSTALAAMRTGKIDLLNNVKHIQAKSMSRTHPKLEQGMLPVGSQSLDMMFGVKPFDDIRVRKAMQLAIDTKAIAKAHYGGSVDGSPAGLFNPVITDAGWGLPYKDWPASLKKEYTYNPTKARQLLSEAGYPNGFKTNVIAPNVFADMELIEIFKSQLMEIGVDMEIRVMDMATWVALAVRRKATQLNWDHMGKSGAIVNVAVLIGMFSPESRSNFGNVSDDNYNRLVQKFNSASTFDEARQCSKDIDQYILERHWFVSACPSVKFNIWQPYLKGYNGESIGDVGQDASIWNRLWIDKELKKSMGF